MKSKIALMTPITSMTPIISKKSIINTLSMGALFCFLIPLSHASNQIGDKKSGRMELIEKIDALKNARTNSKNSADELSKMAVNRKFSFEIQVKSALALAQLCKENVADICVSSLTRIAKNDPTPELTLTRIASRTSSSEDKDFYIQIAKIAKASQQSLVVAKESAPPQKKKGFFQRVFAVFGF